ncbi:MAG: lactonase family protein [Chloroflexi bacterium]|nr:MAG: lactonase family protein [Chloroflexota bacterium]
MRVSTRLAGAAAAAVAVLLSTPGVPAHAASDREGPQHAVFVQNNNPSANAIAAYHRNQDGTLTPAGTFATGGRGGRAGGSGSDPLASQGSLLFIPGHSLLVAVNAGSDSISAFRVRGDQLHLEQVLPSGGSFPVSLGNHGDLLYVLNAGGTGTVSGFRIEDAGLEPIPGSTRSLGLANAPTPFFLSSPAQVGFTPDGHDLLVTTKTHSQVDVFRVGSGGELSAAPVVNAVPGVPFAFLFVGNELALVNAAGSSVATYEVNRDGTLTQDRAPVGDGQAAACWIVRVGNSEFVDNTGSNDVSQYRVGADGSVTLVNPVAASGIAGAIDAAGADRFLYVQAGLDGTVSGFRVGEDGSLTFLQTLAVPFGASQEGIVAG